MELKERVRALSWFLLLAFLIPVFQLWNYQVYQREQLENHPGNPRTREDLTLRGSLLDRHGLPLARTVEGERRYPLGPAAAPLVGYLDRNLGKAGLELSLDQRLRGRPLARSWVEVWTYHQSGGRQGETILTSLDSRLQQQAFQELDGRKGAVVVIEVETGAVMAAATFPSFQPAFLSREWSRLNNDPDAPLIERCSQGLYPPGSTFKIVMASVIDEQSYSCLGVETLNGFRLTDGGHGDISLGQALTVSCNTYFGQAGARVGLDSIRDGMNQLHLLESVAGFPGSQRSYPPEAGNDAFVSAGQAAIGQADMLVTPLAMARLAATVARGGVDRAPYLIGEGSPPQIVIKPDRARLIQTALRAVVTEGTASHLASTNLAGKTGTAENPHGPPHAWFIGYAPHQKPRWAIAVVLENGGSGGQKAAPLAAEILQAAAMLSANLGQ